MAQRASASDLPHDVEQVLESAGEPLADRALNDMEARFGRSFANVRLHQGADADLSAQRLGALAYTVGNHIVFGARQYAPHTAAGQRLLAHELAHVVQQRPLGSGAAPRLAEPGLEHALESDADRLADAALQGNGSPPHASAAAPTLAKQAAPGASPAPAAQQAAPNPCAGAANASQANMGRVPGGRFDAALDRSACPACGLSLTMRVLMTQANAWADAASWNSFQADYIRMLQDRWSNVYDFIPAAGGCPGEGCQRVSVALNVVPVNAAGAPHWTVSVTQTDHFIQSAVNDNSHTANLDSRDLSHDDKPNQIPAEHEGGHMLGLGHTNCGLNGPYAGNINDPQCYGDDDIMGAGSEVTVPEYQVFSETLAALAPGCAWRPAITNARRSRNRTTGQIAGGILGGILGGAAGAGIGFGLGSLAGGAGGLIGAIAGGVVGAALGAVGGVFAGEAIGDSSRRPGEV
jgi:hypothetical protein